MHSILLQSGINGELFIALSMMHNAVVDCMYTLVGY